MRLAIDTGRHVHRRRRQARGRPAHAAQGADHPPRPDRGHPRGDRPRGRGRGPLGRRPAEPLRHGHPRHDARDQRDPDEHRGQDRVPHDGRATRTCSSSAWAGASCRSSTPASTPIRTSRVRSRSRSTSVWTTAGRSCARWTRRRSRAVIAELVELGASRRSACACSGRSPTPRTSSRSARRCARGAPGIAVTLSHQLNPVVREYHRASAACIDASLKPLMAAYLADLESRLTEAGFAGRLLVSSVAGGLMKPQWLADAPIHSINSGPAMAPVAGRHHAEREAQSRMAIVVDAGGTSFDVSVVRNGRIPRTRETWLGDRFVGHITGFPSVDVRTSGSGGGSIAVVDAGGLLTVGPGECRLGSRPRVLRPGRHPGHRDGRKRHSRLPRSAAPRGPRRRDRRRGRTQGDRRSDRRAARPQHRGSSRSSDSRRHRTDGARRRRGHRASRASTLARPCSSREAAPRGSTSSPSRGASAVASSSFLRPAPG